MNSLQKFSITLLSTCAIAACGGGGGGGSGGLSYAGKTTPAAITIDNGQTLAIESFNGGKTGGVIASLTGETFGQRGGSRLVSFYKVVDATLGGLDPTASQDSNPLAATQVDVSDTIPGTCAINPGSYSYSISVNDQTGDYSGSINYSNYCVLGETTNGSSSFTGKINLTSANFDSFSITFTEIQISSAAHASTLSGNLNVDNTTVPAQITMNMLYRDDHTSDIFKVENLIITDDTTTNPGYEDITLQGRFYVPDEGYVDLSTPQTIQTYITDDWPSSGILKVTGKDNGSATLTALSNTSYQVDIDTDGDSVIDLTNTGNWADL